jgi:hypothetical protein
MEGEEDEQREETAPLMQLRQRVADLVHVSSSPMASSADGAHAVPEPLRTQGGWK